MPNKFLVFGNLLVEKDNLALKLLPKLQKAFPYIEFKEFDPTENLEAEIENKSLKIIDVIEDINKVRLIKLSSTEDFNKLHIGKVYSMHDFDLGYNLKLLKKIGKLDSIKVIGIPMEFSEERALREVEKIIKEIS